MLVLESLPEVLHGCREEVFEKYLCRTSMDLFKEDLKLVFVSLVTENMQPEFEEVSLHEEIVRFMKTEDILRHLR